MLIYCRNDSRNSERRYQMGKTKTKTRTKKRKMRMKSRVLWPQNLVPTVLYSNVIATIAILVSEVSV